MRLQSILMARFVGFVRRRPWAARGGFTIVETMIVLAVSALLAVSAMLLINGRQNKTEFQTAINDLQQQFQQLINETESGFYPNNGDITCVGTTTPPTLTAGSANQGTNGGCIFLGKTFQLGTSPQHPDELVIYSVVGDQYTSAGLVAPDIHASYPRAIAPISATESSTPNFPDATAYQPLDGGLSVSSVSAEKGFVDTSATSPYSSPVGQLGVIAGDPNGNLAGFTGSQLASGSQQFSLYIVENTSPGMDQVAGAAAITGTHLKPVTSATLCINSGTTAQSGLFTFGNSSNGGLSVSLKIYSNKDCA